MNKKYTEISKFLSFILRHKPESIGLTLDNEGWANISELIAKAKQSGQELDAELIHAVIKNNEKKRFSISDNGLHIRAAQGHSTESVLIKHAQKMPPDFLYHGTAIRFLESILDEGLCSGERQHVHLSEDIETAMSIGQRYGKPIVLKIAAGQMHQQNFCFFQAENGVWLIDHVPPKFLFTIQ